MALQEMLQNLGGFQSLAANAQQMQQREELSANNRKASELLRSFYQGQQAGKPDYNKLNEAIMLSPEMSQNVLNGIGIQDKQQKQQAATDVVNLYQSLGDPQAFGRVMAQRINGILERGGDPSDSIALTKIYNEQGADAARRAIQQVGAAFVNQGFIKPELVGFGVTAEPMTAYQQASTDLRKQELQLKALESQQKMMERALAKETNDLKKQEIELKLQETQQKIEDNKRQKEVASNEKEAGLESARMNVDNMLNSILRVKNSPDDVIAAATGPVDNLFFTVQRDVADFEELVNTLGSQAFLSQIPLIKGMGQLSNAEGEKLQAALQNFSLRQSPERLKENLAEAQRLLLKARSNIAKQYGKQDTKPDTPAASNAVNVGGYTIVEVK